MWAFPWLMIDAGGAQVTEVVPALGRWFLDSIGKQAEQASKLCFSTASASVLAPRFFLEFLA